MVNSEEYIIGYNVIAFSLIILGIFSNIQNPNSTAHISSNQIVESLRSPSNDSQRYSVNSTASMIALDESIGGKRKTKRKKIKE
jgi:hypothetical protein